mmetsp:Transcript_27894/g.61184  ORF Transcript_27894/g.61184 Transcript_27894/m.61184 type:complete len:305 (-) Transcript_27894:307-1221(-)
MTETLELTRLPVFGEPNLRNLTAVAKGSADCLFVNVPVQIPDEYSDASLLLLRRAAGSGNRFGRGVLNVEPAAGIAIGGPIECNGSFCSLGGAKVDNGRTRTPTIVLKGQFDNLGPIAAILEEVCNLLLGCLPWQAADKNLGVDSIGSILGGSDGSLFRMVLESILGISFGLALLLGFLLVFVHIVGRVGRLSGIVVVVAVTVGIGRRGRRGAAAVTVAIPSGLFRLLGIGHLGILGGFGLVFVVRVVIGRIRIAVATRRTRIAAAVVLLCGGDGDGLFGGLGLGLLVLLVVGRIVVAAIRRRR